MDKLIEIARSPFSHKLFVPGAVKKALTVGNITGVSKLDAWDGKFGICRPQTEKADKQLLVFHHVFEDFVNFL